jgi:hypothetical protein
MKIGVTIVFKKIEPLKIKGVLKSTIVDFNMNDLTRSILSVGSEIAKANDYVYLGVNDIFIVSGTATEGQIMGRTTFYELDTIKKSKTLLHSDFSYDENTSFKFFNCSLIYLCKSKQNEKFTLSILSIVNSSTDEVISKVELMAQDILFLKKIKLFSIKEIEEIKFIGIADICDIDLKFNVFQSFYNEFDNIAALKKEVLSKKEFELMIKDITPIIRSNKAIPQ